MPVLDAILDSTRATLPALRQRAAEFAHACRDAAPTLDFAAALKREHVGLIAEVKRRSPSAGAINAGLDPVLLASQYRDGGAAAISVLTEPAFFGGSLTDLTLVASTVGIPALRKDFLLDEVQLLEARAAGASAILLIVRALEQAQLVQLLSRSSSLGLHALVEVHNAVELQRALDAGAQIIGVNARDLDDFTINRAAAWALLSTIPAALVAVAESGMATAADVHEAAAAGADAVLIGGALAAAPDPKVLAHQLSAVGRHAR